MSLQNNNNALLTAFKALGDLEKNQLKGSLSGSPIALRLYDFLNEAKGDFLSMPKLINHVYASEKATGINEDVLKNRYFKLRQKFLTAIQQQQAPIKPSTTYSFKQEIALEAIRGMLAQNRFTEAEQQLEQLGKDCWDLNLFEFLPEVLDHLVFCSHALLKQDRAANYLKQLQKANELLHALNQCKLLSRKIFDITYNKGTKHANAELKKLSEIAGKHKQYPRFQLGYHHLSLYLKISDPNWLSMKQAVNRHLNTQKKLLQQHPNLPIFIIRPNYPIYQQFILLQTQIMVHFNQLEFNDGLIAIEQMYDLIQTHPILNIYRTVQFYNNMITFLVATRRLNRAKQLIAEFEKMLKQNQWTEDNQMVVLFLKVWIYTEPNSAATTTELKQLLAALSKVIAKRDKTDVGDRTTVRLCIFQFRLYYLLGQTNKAKAVLQNPRIHEWLKQNNLHMLFDGLINNTLNTADTKKQLNKIKYGGVAPDIFIIARWTEDMAMG